MGRRGPRQDLPGDLFHASLPLRELKSAALAAGSAGDGEGKYRTHFHRFMRQVHEQLRAHGGERDRLSLVVRGWRRAGLRVLVLDEFFVGDIGDAMILARLLECMFAEGIVLVTTSNVDPPDLYRDGLQRQRFLPAIDHPGSLQVVHLDSDTDYRLRAARSPVYRAPLDAGSRRGWNRAGELGGDDGHRDAGIEIGRRIPVRARRLVRLARCARARAARRLHRDRARITPCCWAGSRCSTNAATMPRAGSCTTDRLRRQVNLSAPPTRPRALYAGERLAPRSSTSSRLVEMRAEYLAREHRG